MQEFDQTWYEKESPRSLNRKFRHLIKLTRRKHINNLPNYLKNHLDIPLTDAEMILQAAETESSLIKETYAQFMSELVNCSEFQNGLNKSFEDLKEEYTRIYEVMLIPHNNLFRHLLKDLSRQGQENIYKYFSELNYEDDKPLLIGIPKERFLSYIDNLREKNSSNQH